MSEPEMVFFEKRLHPKGWRYVCPICGKSTTGHIPHNRAPRKTMPRSHLDPFGRPCPGAKEKAVLVRNYDEAIAAAKTIIEFMSIPEPMSGCWLWMGAAYDESSYGSVQFYGIKHGAHRLSFEAFHRRLVHGDPCIYEREKFDNYAEGGIGAESGQQVLSAGYDGIETTGENAAYIARLDPQTVASIVTELLSYRKAPSHG